MSTADREPKPASNMDALKQQAEACGEGCACHAAGPSGRTRWLLGGVILLAAAALAVRSVMKTSAAATSRASTAIAAFAASGAAAAVDAVPVAAGPDVVQRQPGVVGKQIAAFAELNTLAADSTAAFVYVPAKGTGSGVTPAEPMTAAARTLAAQGNTIGLFTLKTDSSDYEQISQQVVVPGVLALVKGRGMKAVDGEVTEAKLVQAFVAASSAGGCASGSCGAAESGCK